LTIDAEKTGIGYANVSRGSNNPADTSVLRNAINVMPSDFAALSDHKPNEVREIFLPVAFFPTSHISVSPHPCLPSHLRRVQLLDASFGSSPAVNAYYQRHYLVVRHDDTEVFRSRV
jgi:hypothetical protein